MPDQVRHDGVRLSNCQVNRLAVHIICLVIYATNPASSNTVFGANNCRMVVITPVCLYGTRRQGKQLTLISFYKTVFFLGSANQDHFVIFPERNFGVRVDI